MWYAVEFAGRADIYEFSSRRLRDQWVADGAPHGPGERAALTARDPMVRSTPKWARIDGDAEAWRIIAWERVERSPGLRKYRSIVLEYDWGDSSHHRWVATAPEREVASWAEAIKKAEASVAGE